MIVPVIRYRGIASTAMPSLDNKADHKERIMTPDLLIIGDTHLKSKRISKCLQDTLDSHPSITRVVFLGDINDDWHTTPTERVNGVSDFMGLLDIVSAHAAEPIVLIGNHDVTYLPTVDSTSLLFRNASPGHDYESERRISVMMSAIDSLRIAEHIMIAGVPVVLSHAGFTQGWVDTHMPGTDNDPETIVDRANRMFHDGEWDALYAIGRGRGGFRSTEPSPLWADMHELMRDPATGFDQIVGHTPVSTVNTVHVLDDGEHVSNLIFCDTMSTTYIGFPIGDSSFLLIDTGTGEMNALYDDGLTDDEVPVSEFDRHGSDTTTTHWMSL